MCTRVYECKPVCLYECMQVRQVDSQQYKTYAVMDMWSLYKWHMIDDEHKMHANM